MMEPEVLLVDGTFFLHRILHLPQFVAMSTMDGRKTGGVFGFVNSLRTTLREFPTINKCYVCWDQGRSIRRNALFPEYKANRNLTAEATEIERREKKEYNALFADQQALMERILPVMGCRQLTLPNRESDDLLGWMVYHRPAPKVIVTEDKDLYQFVYEGCTVYRPIQQMKVTAEDFRKIVGIPQPLYLLYKAILGDKSDNIPGLMGETVADRLFGKVSELWDTAPDRPLPEILSDACKILAEGDRRNRKKYDALLGKFDDIRRNLDLMDISRELATFTERESQNLEVMVDSGPVSFNEESFLPITQELQFQSVVQDFISWTYRFRSLT